MKRLIFSAALLTALVGCQSGEELLGDVTTTTEVTSYGELTFDPSGNKMTKAAVDKDVSTFDTSLDTNGDATGTDDFGVIVFTTLDGWATALTAESTESEIDDLDGVSTVITNREGMVTYSKGTEDYQSNAWRTSGDVSMWPNDKSARINVYAYSPHSTTEAEYPTKFTATSMTIEGYDNTAGTTNLMTALAFDNEREVNANGYVTGGNEIALTFYRALAQASFNIALADPTGETPTTNSTSMIAVGSISNGEKAAVYANTDLLLPAAAAAATSAYKVYTGADVYLQEIKLVNIPTKGNCTVTDDGTSDYSTKWALASAGSDLGEYTIYVNGDYAISTDIGDDLRASGCYNKLDATTDADAIALLKGGHLLTTIAEGVARDVDGEKWTSTSTGDVVDDYDAYVASTTGAMNPFFRPLLISPFDDYTTNGVDANDYMNTNEFDSATQPYMQISFYIDCNSDGGSTDTNKHELVVIKKSLNSLLAPNARVTYSLKVELSDLTFSPEIGTLADVTASIDASDSAKDADAN
ncbi:MAG: hypothetical protein SNG14_02180 [Rikenellaceae bacterium]